MARFETFDRDIRVATAGISQDVISAELARFAKSELAKVIASGEGSSIYTRYVNMIEGAPEEAVDAPGPIIYEFSWWEPVILAALAELVKRSPKRSGRYASSFVVIVGGRPVKRFDDISGSQEVIIVNAQPYTRKIEVGAMRMAVPPRHFDKAKAALSRQFGAKGSFRFETRFLNLGAGLHPLIPYHLQRSAGRRKGRQPGDRLSYPAIIMNMVH